MFDDIVEDEVLVLLDYLSSDLEGLVNCIGIINDVEFLLIG